LFRFAQQTAQVFHLGALAGVFHRELAAGVQDVAAAALAKEEVGNDGADGQQDAAAAGRAARAAGEAADWPL
jgi:hypothetical protein